MDVSTCIVAANYVSLQGGRVEYGLVENSTKCWSSTLKRNKSEMEEDADYHGNFDTVKFELWLTRMCKTLKEKHGACTIHMDGASYNKNQTNKCPTMNWSRPSMCTWLTTKGTTLLIILLLIQKLFCIAGRCQVELERHESQAHRAGHASQREVCIPGTSHSSPLWPLLTVYASVSPRASAVELVWATVKGRIANEPPKMATMLFKKYYAGCMLSSKWSSSVCTGTLKAMKMTTPSALENRPNSNSWQRKTNCSYLFEWIVHCLIFSSSYNYLVGQLSDCCAFSCNIGCFLFSTNQMYSWKSTLFP